MQTSLKNTEVVHKGVKWLGDNCDYQSQEGKKRFRFHNESFHGGVTSVIKKTLEKSDSKFHKSEAHKGKRYSCYLCDYKVISKQSLKAHKEAVHEGVEY